MTDRRITERHRLHVAMHTALQKKSREPALRGTRETSLPVGTRESLGTDSLAFDQKSDFARNFAAFLGKKISHVEKHHLMRHRIDPMRKNNCVRPSNRHRVRKL
jgi:hypothetical protein